MYSSVFRSALGGALRCERGVQAWIDVQVCTAGVWRVRMLLLFCWFCWLVLRFAGLQLVFRPGEVIHSRFISWSE